MIFLMLLCFLCAVGAYQFARAFPVTYITIVIAGITLAWFDLLAPTISVVGKAGLAITGWLVS